METPDEWRKRVRHEQERRDDQRRQDEAERRRRSDEAAKRKEAERHNRAMEAAAQMRTQSSLQPSTKVSDAGYATTYKLTAASVEKGSYPRRNRGGFVRLVVIVVALWAVIHFWPQLSEIVQRTRDSSETRHYSSTEKTKAAVLHSAVNASDVDKRIEGVPATKHSIRKYPRCSTTITDQCQE